MSCYLFLRPRNFENFRHFTCHHGWFSICTEDSHNTYTYETIRDKLHAGFALQKDTCRIYNKEATKTIRQLLPRNRAFYGSTQVSPNVVAFFFFLYIYVYVRNTNIRMYANVRSSLEKSKSRHRVIERKEKYNN